MNLHRIKIHPRSPWRTPWQADTLMGALCTTCAHCLGVDVLRAKLIDPMRAGHPPFVLSDAFPSDLLPLPTMLRLADLPAGGDAKTIKRAKWLSAVDFRKACSGAQLSSDAYVQDLTRTEVSRHNALSRDSGGSLDSGGLFARTDTALATETETLALYFRAIDETATELLLDLLYELSLTGFGADIATGRGQFDIDGDPVRADELDDPMDGANGVVVLSTFQPAPNDSTTGCWEAFSKFGKVGPGLGLTDVRKNTMTLLRPGACFASTTCRSFLGHAISMDRFLCRASVDELRSRGIELIHPAFGLAVPAQIGLESPQ